MNFLHRDSRVRQFSPLPEGSRPATPQRLAHEHVPVVAGWLNFESLVDRQISAGRRYGLHPAVLLLDVDLPGQAHSDVLLQALGARLRSRVRSTDVAAQVGERYFGVVLIGAPQAHVSGIKQRLNRALAGPYNMENELIQVNLRMAAAAYPEVSVNGKELVQAALAVLG